MAVEEQKSSKAKTHFVVMTFLFLGGIGLAVYANTWKEQRRVGEVVVEGNRIVPSKEILALAKELEQLAKEERFEELERRMPSLEEMSSFMQSMFSQHTDSDAAKFREYDRQVLQ